MYIKHVAAIAFVLTIFGSLPGIFGLIGVLFAGVIGGRVLGSLPAVAASVGAATVLLLLFGVTIGILSGDGQAVLGAVIGSGITGVVAGVAGGVGASTPGAGGY